MTQPTAIFDRRVLLLGGSLAITLPNPWVRAHGVLKGAAVWLTSYRGEGANGRGLHTG